MKLDFLTNFTKNKLMENADLKIELIQKIIQTNDLNILMDISELLHFENTILQVKEPVEVYEKKEKVYVLNDWQKARIKKAKQQIENGEYLTEEEADIEMQKWFEEEEKLYGQ